MKGKRWATLGLIAVAMAGALLLSGCELGGMTGDDFLMGPGGIGVWVHSNGELEVTFTAIDSANKQDERDGLMDEASQQDLLIVPDVRDPVVKLREELSDVPGALVEPFTNPETGEDGASVLVPFTSFAAFADMANQNAGGGGSPLVTWSQEGSVYTLTLGRDTGVAPEPDAGGEKIPFSFAVPGKILDYSPKEGATYDAENNALIWNVDLKAQTEPIMVKWDNAVPPAVEVQPQPQPAAPQPVQPPPPATLAPALLATEPPLAPLPAPALGPVPAPPPAVPQAWSNQGRIAFASNFEGDYEIYTINPDGTGLNRLTTTSGVDWFPAWSPDGSKITYQCSRAERVELCLMDADGANQRQLTQNGGAAGAVKPAWSPDSAQLAYFVAAQGIHIVNADGSNDRLISPETSWDLTWSPDGTQLALSRNGTMMIVDSNGVVLRNLMQGVQPAWSPGRGTTVPAAPAPAQIQPEPVIPAQPQPAAPAPAQIQPEPVVPAPAQVQVEPPPLVPAPPAAEVQPPPQPAAPAPAQVQPQPQPAAPDVTAGLSGYIAYPVFKAGMSKPTYDIFVTRTDGSDRRLLWEWGRQPDIRPGDGRVVLNGDGQGRDNLWTVNLDGSDAKESSLHPEDSHPRWGPNGDRLLFDSQFYLWNDQRQWTVWLQNGAGKGTEPVSVSVADRVVPGESPIWLDNDWVVYTGCNFWEHASRCGLYTNPSWGDARARQLTDQAEDRAGDFYGDRIAYMSRGSGSWDVWTVNFDGGGKVNLSNHPANDGLPAFSPDGGKVAFVSDREDVWAIWVMNADGSSPQKLFDIGGTMGEDWTTERISWGSVG